MNLRVGVSAKLVVMVMASIIISGACAIYASYQYVVEGFESEVRDSAEVCQKVIEHSINSLKQQYIGLADSLAKRPNIIKGISESNTDFLKGFGKDLVVSKASDFVVFTDHEGKVLARDHDEKFGDSIAGQECVKSALAGQSCVMFEPGTVVKVSLRISSPVKKDGKVIGSMIVGMNISNEDRFVDEMKKLLGVEVTIYYGDTRASTTILKDGKRVIGTKMDNKEVLSNVLTDKKIHNININLFGKQYNAIYWPLLDNKNKPIGMMFLGKNMSEVDADSWRVVKSIIYAIGGSALILGILGYFMSRRFTNPINKLVAYAGKVESGDLDQELDVKSNDEIGDLSISLKNMVLALKNKIIESNAAMDKAAEEAHKAQEATAEVEKAKLKAESARKEGMLQAANHLQSVVEIVTSASEQLSSQIEESSRGTEIQSNRVTETATAMEEMNTTVLEVAKNASHAAEMADKAKHKAEDGALIVNKVVNGINDVQAQALGIKSDMTSLGKQAQAIGQVLDVISDIADQTNLLALNAAIEAARAGDAGRGFAVVADEVRKLAEKTMTATREVGDAIHGIQSGTKKNIESVELAVQTIETATELAENSGLALNEIVNLVDSTTDQVRTIATASEEQSATSEEINRSIEDINRISSETAEGMRNSAKAVAELAKQASILNQLIATMKNES